jgi:hypothetical protein
MADERSFRSCFTIPMKDYLLRGIEDLVRPAENGHGRPSQELNQKHETETEEHIIGLERCLRNPTKGPAARPATL